MSFESGHVSPFLPPPAPPRPYEPGAAPARREAGPATAAAGEGTAFAAALAEEGGGRVRTAPDAPAGPATQRRAAAEEAVAAPSRRLFPGASHEVGGDYFARPVTTGDLARADAQTNHAAAELGFDDLVDLINPLQHIPLVGELYRAVTGDQISGPARILGGLAFGGPVGFVASAITSVVEEANGGEPVADTMVAALFGGAGERAQPAPEAAVASGTDGPAVADTTDPNLGASPLETAAGRDGARAAAAEVSSAATDGLRAGADSSGEGALTGAAALAAFMNDLHSVGQAADGETATAPDSRKPNSTAETETAGAREPLPAPPARDARTGDLPAPGTGLPLTAYQEATGRQPAGPRFVPTSSTLAPPAPANALPAPAEAAGALAADAAIAGHAGQGGEAVVPPAGSSFAARMLQALDKYAAMANQPTPGMVRR